MTVDGQPANAITLDVDTTRFYRAIHGLPPLPTSGADVAYDVGLRRFLEVCDACGIKATLFVIGSDIEHPAHAALLTQAHRHGHELANHTYHHRYDLRRHAAPIIAQDIDLGAGRHRESHRRKARGLSHPRLQPRPRHLRPPHRFWPLPLRLIPFSLPPLLGRQSQHHDRPAPAWQTLKEHDDQGRHAQSPDHPVYAQEK